eukprot:CAMPEP_0185575866 /NCGR_PEP_ID=MMETSP0434-20130131/6931_1 /TAXON_ID=626734 ORGANISM="Favella taraikaensis, Strain Fe Narragansett Bay" /NCGR_SAMPLE_ID=MMETSP0434 /ASSEMBLY_ACC=CAM_ASM_000379 /LENGTH=71 /DNA_ID=CAMNT_0028192863 /DNA_START=1496 /DNA_END=1712 /DNA_ORIENTATION=+
MTGAHSLADLNQQGQMGHDLNYGDRAKEQSEELLDNEREDQVAYDDNLAQKLQLFDFFYCKSFVVLGRHRD